MNISSNNFCRGPCCISKDLRNRSIKFCYIQGTCIHDHENHSDGEDYVVIDDCDCEILRRPLDIVRNKKLNLVY